MFLDWFLTSEHNTQQLFIMRGLPGSGKSFDAEKLAPKGQIFGADQLFYIDGVYTFDEAKLNHAHNICKGNVQQAMRRRITPIVVDNTNVRVAEIFPFLELALQYGYKVEIKEPMSPWWVKDISPFLVEKEKWPEELDRGAEILFEKNQHGVPLETIKRMLRRWHAPVSAEDMMKSILRKK